MSDRYRETDVLIPEDRVDTRPSPRHHDDDTYDDGPEAVDECMLSRGDRIEDKYEIVLLLGKGGMGEVYLARDVLLDRHVAIKVLQASLLGRFERTAAKRFLREARIISNLRHPNTVTVFSYGTLPAGNAYIVMEYIEGQALDERLESDGALGLDVVVSIFTQICLALKEAHQKGIVHRDLKPANILLTDIGDTKDFVKVLDFGLAKRFKDEPDVDDATVTASEAILGSPAYMSPEQASGLPLDPRSDIYSLGIVLYEMITDKLPLTGRTPLEFLNAQITKKPVPPRARRPDLVIPEPLETIVMRMLEKDPDHRYSSIESVMDAVEKMLQGDAVSSNITRPFGRERRPSKELKLLTVMSCHVDGFTELVGDLEPEALKEMEERLLERLFFEILRFGGAVQKYDSGEITAVFGYPVVGEDDAARAIKAALAVRSRLSKLAASDFLAATDDEPLTTRIGLATGQVLVEDDPKGDRFSLTGDPVHLANGLSAIADDDEVVTAFATYRHVRGLFDVEVLPNQRVPGRRGRMTVVSIKGQKDPYTSAVGRVPQPRSIRGVEVDFVGRSMELGQLTMLLDSTLDESQLQVVLVSAGAGIGKTRLVTEFLRHGDELPAMIRLEYVDVSPEETASPYGPFAAILRYRAGIRETDGDEEIIAKLGALMDKEGPATVSREEGSILFAHLLSVDISGTPLGRRFQGNPEQLKAKAFHTMGRFYQALGEALPLCFVFEGLEHAPDPTFELMTYVMEYLRELPVLFVVTTRDNIRSIQDKLTAFSEYCSAVTLKSLSREQSFALTRSILQRVPDVPDTFCQAVFDLSEGNPLFIEEIVEKLVDDGLIRTKRERWSIAGEALDRIDVPDTIGGLILARLDRLDPFDKEAIRKASVAGRRFWKDLLAEMGVENVDALLRRLSLKGLVSRRYASSLPGEEEYVFKQQAVRDVIYENTLKEFKRTHHVLVAEWLEEKGRDNVDELAETLAFHYSKAGDLGKALHYETIAAARAERVFANLDALRHFDASLGLIDRMAKEVRESAPILDKRLAIIEAEGQVCKRIGRYREAAEHFSRGLDIARAHPDVARRLPMTAWFKILGGEVLEERGSYQEALERYTSALDALGDETREHTVVVYALGRAAAMSVRLGNYDRAIETANAALGHADDAPSQDDQLLRSVGNVHNILGNAYFYQSKMDEAERHYQEALASRERLGDYAGIAVVHNNLGNLYLMRAELERAEEQYHEALGRYDKIGYRFGELISSSNLGDCYLRQGKLDEAARWLERAIAISEEIESKDVAADTYTTLAEVHLELDRLDDALEESLKARDIAAQLGNKSYEGVALRVLGRVKEAFFDKTGLDEQASQAQESYAKALSLLSSVNIPGEEVRCLLDYGRFLTVHDRDPHSGRKMLQTALERAMLHGLAREEARARSLIDDLA